MEWVVLIVLASGMDPVMWLTNYPTEDACKTAITETISPLFDRETRILAPYPKYQCFDANKSN